MSLDTKLFILDTSMRLVACFTIACFVGAWLKWRRHSRRKSERRR